MPTSRPERCLSTRTDETGVRYRRYERPDGTRYTTAEVPLEKWRAFVPARKPWANGGRE